jgi:predicted RNA-binding protein YlqC (UPF0109 family)
MDATENKMEQEFLDHIIKLIVTKPEEVEISRSVDELGVLITLKVSKEDMGRIIGKEGQTAKAIRTLLRVIGSRNNERVNLKILEPEGGEVNLGGNGEVENE